LGAVPNTELDEGLFQVAANGLLTKFERLRSVRDAVARGQQAQYGKLASRQERRLADAVGLRSNELMKADGGKGRTHEENGTRLIRQELG
jgi:hypothetical protein